MKSPSAILPFLLFFLSVFCRASPDTENQPVSLDDIHLGTPQIDLRIMKAYGGPSKPVQEFFQIARQRLEDFPQSPMEAYETITAAAGEAGLTHLGGPMLGDLRPDGASIWIRTTKPAAVRAIITTPAGERSYGPVYSSKETFLTAKLTIIGLEADTTYPYRLTVDDVPLSIAGSACIQTLPAGDPVESFRVAFGSCFHKQGQYNTALLEQMRKRENRALLIYGDLAVDDRRTHIGLHLGDYLLRDLSPPWQKLSASMPVYALWDDHDYWDDDLVGIPPLSRSEKLTLQRTWQDNWNNPASGFGGEDGGIFFRTRIGPMDLIMLDTRYFRKGNPIEGDEDTSFIGDKPMAWLEAELPKCRGPFIVITSGTMWSDYISAGKDSWGVWHPEGREQLFSFIEERNIPGVILLSGDRHGARGFRIPRESGHTFYEFEPASLGGLTVPPAIADDASEQLFGHAGLHAFGELEFNTKASDPEATFRLIEADGSELYSITLKRSELTPKRNIVSELPDSETRIECLDTPDSALFTMEGFHLWDPSVIKVGDTYHLFASRWESDHSENRAFHGWTSSHVIRASSDSLYGPYEFQEVVLRPRGGKWDSQGIHNPKIVKTEEGFLLVYLGIPGWKGGIAESDHVTGQWRRRDQPTIPTHNPALWIHEDGEAYVVGKRRSPLVPNVEPWTNWMDAYRAEQYEGPYKPVGDPGTNRLPEGHQLEDPTLWWDGEKYNVILVDWRARASGIHQAGLHYTSTYGADFKLVSRQPLFLPHSIPLDKWQEMQLIRRERPQIVLDADNQPIALCTAWREEGGESGVAITPVTLTSAR